MATHTGRAFLNSCLKVPIDPCNNCPAPIYNRPKMYLGRFSTTPMRSVTTTGKLTTATSLKSTEIETDAMWTSTGVRSLAKFYDSIPDYCEINHLPEEEFYSTLDTLKSTCRELKTKSLNSFVLDESSNTSLSSHCGKSKQSKKSSSSSKKKLAAGKSGNKKKSHHQKQHQWSHGAEDVSRCVTETPCSLDAKRHIQGSTRPKCFKSDFAHEVEELKKNLEDFEAEFKRPTSSSIYRPKSTSHARKAKDAAQFSADNTKQNVEKAPVRTFSTCLRESIKKSFSFNDLHSLHESTGARHESVHSSREELILEDGKKKPFDKLTRAEILAFKDRNRLSNYFMQKPPSTNENNSDLPKIVVESPSSETLSSKLSNASTSRNNGGRKKKSRSKKREEQIRVPFTLFDLTADFKNDNLELHSSPSPVHPVARPNLAATLRAEVSKKKVKELQNNCTYHDDTTPQFDWEVRKTPAWKSLSLNESHKEILLVRLATRKAEQALQRREYDLDMELMRQRVKSAPLLLEGATFWGPNVGKLTHTCVREGRRHACQSNLQRRQRRRSASSSRVDGGYEAETAAIDAGSRLSHRINTLRTIYASSAANYSRNSRSQDNARQSSRKQHSRRRRTKEDEGEEDAQSAGNDSGDELSSVDRAYL